MKNTILFFVSLLVQLNIIAQSNVTLSGEISDLKSGMAIEGVQISLKEQGTDAPAQKTVSDSEGKYSLMIDSKKRYILEARKENYTDSRKLIYPSLSEITEKKVDIKLYPIREFFFRDGNKLIDVGHVGFETDGSELTPFIKEKLDIVVNVMKKYPKIRVSVDVHTDSKGDPDYSMQISKERAGVVVAYLTEKGIDPDRLEAHGYGDTQLINHCAKGIKCTEQQHKQNRRIDFVIIP